MLFNSIDFAIFLPVVFLLYWFATGRSLRLQNLLIVAASYVFYGWWDWRFLSLILFSTVVDYSVGRALTHQQNHHKRRLLLWTSILVNLGFLGFFKYCNFFLDNLVAGFTFLGGEITTRSLDIILPIGISFYTFQTLSYTIDVYRRKLEPTNDFIAFAAFVGFFPQLVAGPIERATNLLPQFCHKRSFRYDLAVDGMRQILWGLFKKVVIADNCAKFADLTFGVSSDYPGNFLLLGVVLFAFQIYADFSGYSDIAIGASRLFGFNLKQNFAFPYFSRDIAEFWRRWHISLSSWFRDYLYIPLGGSRGGTGSRVRNTFAIFIVSGLWHGANWTFVVWGVLNALYFLPLLLSNSNRQHMDVVAYKRGWPTIKETGSMLFTFSLTVLAWTFFRADNIGHAFDYVSQIISSSFFAVPEFPKKKTLLATLLLVLAFVLIEWKGRANQYAIEKLWVDWNPLARYGMYYLLAFFIFWFSGNEQEFVYFQF